MFQSRAFISISRQMFSKLTTLQVKIEKKVVDFGNISMFTSSTSQCSGICVHDFYPCTQKVILKINKNLIINYFIRITVNNNRKLVNLNQNLVVTNFVVFLAKKIVVILLTRFCFFPEFFFRTYNLSYWNRWDKSEIRFARSFTEQSEHLMVDSIGKNKLMAKIWA